MLFDIIIASEIKITASDPAPNNNFGSSVSIYGDYAIIGSPLNDTVYLNAGSAYIFKNNKTSWIEQALLTASDGYYNDYFGESVAILGDYVVIGAPGGNGKITDSGAAYIFRRSGSFWNEHTKLNAIDEEQGAYFGCSVALSDEYVIVGSRYAGNNKGYSLGSAYIFDQQGTQQSKLVANDGGENDYFGSSVSISGNYAIVGSYNNDNENGRDAGAAYIFYKSGLNWIQQSKLISDDGSTGDHFGFSVSINGDYAVIGAWSDSNENGQSAGSIYIFNRENNDWIQQTKIKCSNGFELEHFGYSVSIFGNYIMVGTNNDFKENVYIFSKYEDNWIQRQVQTASDGISGDEFGHSVSISQNYAIVGAKSSDGIFFNSGTAYIYNNIEDLFLPVELSFFTATNVANGIEIKWETQTESDNYGFIIERSVLRDNESTISSWEVIGFIKGKGTTTIPQKYNFIDDSINKYIGTETVYYRLKQIDTDGSYEYSKTLIIRLNSQKTVQLYQNYPNPFNLSTKIRYAVSQTELINLEIFNGLGQSIKVLVNDIMPPGEYEVEWDGKDLNDHFVTNGIYFYTLKSRENSKIFRYMIMLK